MNIKNCYLCKSSAENGLSEIKIADAVRVQKALSKAQIVTAAEAITSDVNEDSKFNVLTLY